MSIRKLMVFLYSAGGVVLAGLVAVTTLLVQNQQALTAAQDNRYRSYLLADELRQSSDDLTNLARTYVVTGDKRHEDAYWHVLDVRNGKTPRKDGRTTALQTLMKEAGFTDAEFEKLRESERNSNGLVTTETIAMNAVKGLFDDGSGKYTKSGTPDPEMARRIMFDDKYHADKALIMAPIAQFDAMLDERTQALVDTYVRRNSIYLGLLGTLVLIGGALAIAMVRYMNRTLTSATAELRQTIDQFAAASGQVAASSQTLSEGATSQAASLEETSASMEEMASMTRKNAENAGQAATLMFETERLVQGANGALGEMVTSMAMIKESSDKVARIIRTIDEIAFQTNILALNAAVEAARAGEAGMGFAVVADEVRNLAQRAAQAARDTTQLIEESMARSSEGDGSVQQVRTSIAEITSATSELTEALQGIHAVARQQAQGLAQIAAAVQQMGQTTQTTAANAEESAAASEVLHAQAHGAMQAVGALEAIAGAEARQAAPTRTVATVVRQAARPARRPAASPVRRTGTRG
jgi:methyl-accepting chemotaxis protein